MRSTGLSPHHLVHRPSGRDGALPRHHPRRQGRLSGAAVERQPRGGGRRARRAPLRDLRGPLPQAVLPVRAGGGQARAARGPLPGQEAVRLRRAGQARPGRLGDGLPEARHRLGRAPLRPRARPGRVQDRRGRRLQLRGDGEQGPQHLQHQVRAGARRHRDRHRLPQHRPRGGARVLPQLDRRPGHLPRLVPALAQGRPHGVPRPGIRRRQLLARGDPHRRGAHAARGAVPRGRRPDGAPGAAAVVHGDPQFLHHDGVREGRGSGAHAAHAAGRGALPAGHEALLRAPRRPGGDLRRLRAGDAGRERRRPRPVPALVRRPRHAGARLPRRLRRRNLHAAREAVDEPALPHSAGGKGRGPRRGSFDSFSGREIRIQESEVETCSVSPARLLRPGRAQLPVHRGRPDPSHGRGRRRVQPLGGRAAADGDHRPRARRRAVEGFPRRLRAGAGRQRRRPRVRGRGARAALRVLPRRADARSRPRRAARGAQPAAAAHRRGAARAAARRLRRQRNRRALLARRRLRRPPRVAETSAWAS